MDIETYRDYCLSKKGATESFPFSQDILVFKVAEKMFTVTGINTFSSISVKCDPELVEELREQYAAVNAPSYLNKRHWNSVAMDRSIPDHVIYKWIDDSYDLVVKNMSKNTKAKFGL